jgi:oxaloacetate decarboxylase alpha subunit
VPAPLAGNIFKVEVQPGEKVKQGDVLLILEAMKMETEVRAPHDGTVLKLAVREGDSVALKDPLLYIS